MFGWEFPPHIAGGLGTACYGMTRGLARNGVEVVFVMPRAYGDEDQRFVRVVNASDVETIGTRDHEFSEELLEKVSFIHIDSNMLPYISPEEYAAYHDEFVRSGRTHEWTDVWKQRYTFSGKYGANLMEEVARYAMVAAQVAKDLEGQFDVIHAHDWLTYFAGIAAKRVSGKPLVVHMHATEFDRSGENINGGLLVSVTPEDFPSGDTLAGVRFQRELEDAAYRLGGGNYAAPAQRVEDFLKHRPSTGAGKVMPTYLPSVRWCDLHGCLPPFVCEALEEGLPMLGRKLRGFDAPDAVLTAVETRSSSPVRIVRDNLSFQSALRGLYPCGEGAGYAGGIMSAAADGLRVAEMILEELNHE